VHDFKYAALPNGDWFVLPEAFEGMIAWASSQGYAITILSGLGDDADLYGAVVRHGLRDVYVIPAVLSLETAIHA
jgi:hypothetical protein